MSYLSVKAGGDTARNDGEITSFGGWSSFRYLSSNIFVLLYVL